MSSEQFYKPSGELQGDTTSIPSRGTGTGMTGNAQTLGRSTDVNATNRIGSAATKSDPADKNMPCGGGRK